MSGLAIRVSGGTIALVGAIYGVFFLVDAATTSAPFYWLLQSYPIGLSAALVVVGLLLARGRLVPDRYLRRLLTWMVGGVVVFSMMVAWFYGLTVLVNGRTPLDPPLGIIALPALGALVGLLTGTYDVRAIDQKQAVSQLSKINETLRIATSELVEKTERDALEEAVCSRLVESDSFDAAWIGRLDADDGCVHPSAWVGFTDDAVESLSIPLEVGQTSERVWTRVIDTREGQLVQDVPGDETLEEWKDTFERHGVGSVAVVPVVGVESTYGLICICASEQNAFDEHLLDVLSELGETVGHAIDSIRAHRALEIREQELVTQNDRLDEFAGVVSHDLRNPLNVVLGRVALMKEDGDESEHLEPIEQSTRRMEEIISDLLALSRASRADVDSEPVLLGTVAEASWQTTEAAGVEFDLRIQDPTTIRADPARLRTVFENLFRNAAEHNGTPLTVTVGVLDTTTADSRSAFGFFVEDDGAGIPADHRDEIFDHGYTTNADGTGFGLAIVRGIVDAHDWEISIRDGQAGGARIEITGVEFVS